MAKFDCFVLITDKIVNYVAHKFIFYRKENMAGKVQNSCNSFIHGTLLTYSTVKVVQVPNTYIAIIHRVVQVLILGYIIGYIVVYKKGYQQFQEPQGTSVIKVKGVAKVTGNKTFFYISDEKKYIWDTPEYEKPPIENNAFFIATHQTVTYDQKQDLCPTALADNLTCDAENTALCKKDQPLPNTFGYFTGKCVPSSQDMNITVCEMNGWCPEELSNSIDFIIDEGDLLKFTVFLKTMVTFTTFKKNLRNIHNYTNFQCRFDGTPATADCPIVSVGYILDQFTTNRTALLLEGGLIEIRQDWRCNFDFNADKCIPTYQFGLLQSGDDAQSPGINYRYGDKYRINGTDYRTLSKVYGLRFVIAISGLGGQFNIVNLFLAIGSGIGFMVIAGIVADIFLMYIHKSRTALRGGKISIVEVNQKDGVQLLERP